MARKPSDVIQYKIRIREDLRRRLEQAAEKGDVSINSEIASRLGKSFDLPKLDKITARLESAYGRFVRETRDRSQTQDLMNAVEALIKATEGRDPEAVKRSIAWAQESMAAIARAQGRTYADDELGDQK